MRSQWRCGPPIVWSPGVRPTYSFYDVLHLVWKYGVTPIVRLLDWHYHQHFRRFKILNREKGNRRVQRARNAKLLNEGGLIEATERLTSLFAAAPAKTAIHWQGHGKETQVSIWRVRTTQHLRRSGAYYGVLQIRGSQRTGWTNYEIVHSAPSQSCYFCKGASGCVISWFLRYKG